MTRRLPLLGAVVLVLGAGLGLGRATAPSDGGAAHHPSAPTSASSPAAPSPADVGFAQDMAVHHDQAVRMARLVRGRVDPRIDAVAAQIVEVQTRETGMLRGWLALWGAPQLPAGPAMAWMDHDHTAPAAADGPPMPGLASTAEVDELTTLAGRDLEARFLQLMVRHHRGGVEMAGAGADRATVPAVRDAARLMATEQQQEIALMLPLLAERGVTEV